MFARFFVDRPVFATVLSVVIVILGVVAYTKLPVAQYPEVTPPTVSIVAVYPGANAQTVAATVAAPIEQEVNGVERMLYMSSRSANDGTMSLDVTFEVGTNLDMAQVLVQNRVQIATAKLPEEVKRQGVTVKKKSPSILMCVNLVSDAEHPEYDQLFLSNFATLQVKDEIARLPGVGDVAFFGPRDYSMRIWLDPNKLATRGMTVGDVLQAVKEQNVQVAAGRLGQPPTPLGQNFQLTINTQGRLDEPAQFLDIVVKTGEGGKVVYLKDVVRDTTVGPDGLPVGGVELGAKNYDVSTYLTDVKAGTRIPCITLTVFQSPGSNALATADAIKAKMAELKKTAQWKQGIDYRIVYDTTVFVAESIHEVWKTLFEAFVLVFIVVLLFLQDWRATLLPMIDVPVSLVGTLAVMALLGFSLNNLSLFGLVLAIGIVVDDAIVVVENVERWMAKGLPPREATIKAMDEITGPVIAITLVLSAVFIPTVFLAGISGQFFKQFALTIATSTIISALNALTMAPARAVTLIKPHAHGPSDGREALPRWGVALLGGGLVLWLLYDSVAPRVGIPVHHGHGDSPHAPTAAVWGLRLGLFALGAVAGWFAFPVVNAALLKFFDLFNKVFNWITAGYGLMVRGAVRLGVIMMLLYAGLIGLTYLGFTRTPQGFIPDQDKGYLIAGIQLPEGASLERTEAVTARMSEAAAKVPGIAYMLEVPGYSPFAASNLSNQAALFIILAPFEERKHNPDLAAGQILPRLRQAMNAVEGAVAGVFGAPAVDGLGSTGGFKLQMLDKGNAGLARLQGAVQNVIGAGNQPGSGVVGLFSSFSVNQPQVMVNVDRVKAKSMGVSLTEVFQTLQAYLGSAYVNDITKFDRNWQVNLQADARFRLQPEDIGRLEVRNSAGKRVPLSTLITVEDVNGPSLVNHYNLFPSAEVLGNPALGRSSMQAIRAMDALATDPGLVPSEIGSAWTELSLLQIKASEDLLSKLVFPLAVVFVFMVLAAQYESWSLPLAIILIVPMCLLAAIIGVRLVRLDINIFTQIGLVVLVALAAKNAILIVEFAKQREDEGLSRRDAVVDACKTRLRPIIMTSLAFILGVVPLILGKGAGAEMRFALGVAVFCGMLGVTFFGLFFTPVFYDLIRRFGPEPKGSPSVPAPDGNGQTASGGQSHSTVKH